MPYDYQLVCHLPAAPKEVYAAWLDSETHCEMTGAPALIAAIVGAPYTTWDGYICGETLDLVPDRRIVQSWRTSEFGDEDADSRVTIELEPTATGTRLRLFHESVPDGQTSYEESGWQDFYFAPMQAYFERAKQKAREVLDRRLRERERSDSSGRPTSPGSPRRRRRASKDARPPSG